MKKTVEVFCGCNDFSRTEITDDHEQTNIQKFKRQYRDNTPIWWYTYECVLYPMLNRAVRVIDMDIIIKMRFCVSDLHRHVEQLHKIQFSGGHSFIVYPEQDLSKVDFDEMIEQRVNWCRLTASCQPVRIAVVLSNIFLLEWCVLSNCIMILTYCTQRNTLSLNFRNGVHT